ncbi:MAG: hypothetical protein ABIO92_07465 [Chloroflexia bacterium]
MIYELEKDGTRRSLGDPANLQLADVVERVRGVVGDEWEKTAYIRAALGEPLPSLPQVRTALTELTHKDDVERDPPISDNHSRGHMVKWRRTALSEVETYK